MEWNDGKSVVVSNIRQLKGWYKFKKLFRLFVFSGGNRFFFVLIIPPYVLFSQLPFLPYPMAVTFLPSGMTCFLGFI
jgi:hypothetical protein